jgi:hypothetical protein
MGSGCNPTGRLCLRPNIEAHDHTEAGDHIAMNLDVVTTSTLNLPSP